MLKRNILINWLSTASSYIFPLITLPFLSRSLSSSQLAIYFVSLSFYSIGLAIADFGFNTTACRRITLTLDSNSSPLGIIVDTTLIKFTLVFVYALVWRFLDGSLEYPLYITVICYVLLTTLYPSWYFIGSLSIRANTFIVFVGKLTSFILLIIYLLSSVS